jgi:molybdopterin-guanine dinucleotide biosynthesis protein A
MPICDGVVLAGGVGSRFGHPKATVRLGDRTLVERAVAALEGRCRRVVVVARSDTPLPAVTSPIVFDEPGAPSALRGIVSGLRAVTAPFVAVLGCDIVAAPSLLDRVINAESDDSRCAVDENGLQPLCARVRRDHAVAVADAMLANGELRLRSFAAALAVTPVPVEEGELRNVNTWIDGLAAALDVPAPSSAVVGDILDLTRIVAHGTERTNGPVASFLAGYLAAQTGGEAAAAVRTAIAAAESLVDRGT